MSQRSAVAGTGRSAALDHHEPALDGLRAMSIAVVLAYHGQLPWVKGAFLGISQFFTLSGFLITSILLRTHAATATIDLRAFWARRYRRLLPAAYLTLAGVVVFGATIATEQQLDDLLGAVVAAIAQVANWFFVATGRSYVDLFGAPSPVQHFWSLAIEEQFYVFMPIVLLVLLRYVRSPVIIGGIFAAGALASSGLMYALYERGASLDRLYYGTDTRVAELLVGCVIAVVMHSVPFRPGALARMIWAVVGIVAFAGIVWGWTHVTLFDAMLWRGGYLLFALLSAALIVSVLSGAGPVRTLFGAPPLAAMGRVSYGLYLYHWPVFLWIDDERVALGLWPLFALRIAVTFAIAIASYHFVEMPIRNGSIRLPARGLRWVAAAAVAGIVAGVSVAGARDVETDLAGLDESIGSAPPAPADPVLDVLVIADAAGRDLAAELVAASKTNPDLVVTIAEPFECAGTAAYGGSTTCSNWIDEWPRLVADVDPDIVLFRVSSWDRAEIARLSASNELAVQRTWTTEALAAGFDLLSSRGAPVAWGTDTLDVDAVLQRPNDPFFLSMDALTNERVDTRRLEAGKDADATLDDLETYRRRRESDTPRVLVVGDSSSRTLGYGLERWASANGRALVWSAGTGGCGIADDGELRDGAQRPIPVPDRCRAVGDHWRRQVEDFEPDLVIVLSTIFDLQQRRLDDWPDFLVPGNPRFDDYLVDEYVRGYDLLSSRGARVLWMNNPCARISIGPWPGDDRGGPVAPARIAYANDVILGRLAEQRPGLRVFDLFGIVCPDNRFVNRIGGIDDFRPDGVHFAPEASLWLAENYGAAMLEAGLGDP